MVMLIYKYMLVYVDDVINLAKDAQEDILRINQDNQLREGFGPSGRYLGANVDKFQLEDEISVWCMTYVEYLRGAIKNVDSILEGNMAVLKFFKDGNCP